jgi:hypothetical protein
MTAYLGLGGPEHGAYEPGTVSRRAPLRLPDFCRSQSRFHVSTFAATTRAPMAHDVFDDFKKLLIGGWEG